MRRLGLNASCERRVEAVPLKPGAIPGPINSAHRSFVAFEIFALAAADITRFFPPVVLPLLLPIASPLPFIPPKSFIAARTVSNCCCATFTCFSNFASSCLNATKTSMNPPEGYPLTIVSRYEFSSVLQRLVEEANLTSELLEEPLWDFKSQSGNPAMSPYWTFREGRQSALTATC